MEASDLEFSHSPCEQSLSFIEVRHGNRLAETTSWNLPNLGLGIAAIGGIGDRLDIIMLQTKAMKLAGNDRVSWSVIFRSKQNDHSNTH